MKLLKKGDPCPCCGRPIPTDDPERLLVLSWLAEYQAIRDVIRTQQAAPDWAAHLLNRFTKVE